MLFCCHGYLPLFHDPDLLCCLLEPWGTHPGLLLLVFGGEIYMSHQNYRDKQEKYNYDSVVIYRRICVAKNLLFWSKRNPGSVGKYLHI